MARNTYKNDPTYKMLMQCLKEAKQRIKDYVEFPDVVARSQETVDLINQRLERNFA